MIMNLLKDNLNTLYAKYLFTAFGSSIISSIYATVDTIVSGQYEGPMGSAALSVIMPLWTLIFSIGLLFGIGGAIMMGNDRGAGRKERGDGYFALSLALAVGVALVITILFVIFREEFLMFCGADEAVLPYAMAYTKWLIPSLPLFLIGQVLIAFIRNDGAPKLTMIANMSGGIFNILGDLFFVFGLDMGIEGAGLATAMGQFLGFSILLSYFFQERCQLRLVKITNIKSYLPRILSVGFAPFIIDISFGVAVILFNKQIMRYAGAVELAVFGTVASVAMIFQSLFYGVGQAIQPIVSINAGAGEKDRVKETLHLAMFTSAAMGLLFTIVIVAFPMAVLSAYMDATTEVLQAGPIILRIYGISFLLMGINVVASYFLQAMLETSKSMVISLLRGFILCSIFLLLLPPLFGFETIWWTMPLTEGITFIVAVKLLKGVEKKNPLLV